MDRDRLQGIIMIGCVIFSIVIYLFMNSQVNSLEQENEEISNQLSEARSNNQSNNESNSNDIPSNDNTNNEDNSSTEENESTTESETNDESASTNEPSETNEEAYDEVIDNLLNTIYTVDDMEQREGQLEPITTENSNQYLRENYFLLTEEDLETMQESSDVDSQEEGGFEPYELEMEVTNTQKYYKTNNGQTEFVTMFQLITQTEDDNFSGNFVFKGTIEEDESDIKVDEIQSITPLNDPNSNDLFSN